MTWIERSYHRKRRQRALGKLTAIELDAFVAQQTPVRRRRVGAVGDHHLRSASRHHHRVERRRRVVGLTGRKQHGQAATGAVGGEMDLGAQPPTGAPDDMAGRFIARSPSRRPRRRQRVALGDLAIGQVKDSMRTEHILRQ
ncbi:hypothetical protein [Nocardia beijingensis]